MKLKEFRDRIERAREIAGKNTSGYGVCYSIGKSFYDHRPVSLFSSLFRPDENKGLFWLGYFNSEGAERRLFYLDMFEAYCISFKVYKEF